MAARIGDESDDVQLAWKWVEQMRKAGGTKVRNLGGGTDDPVYHMFANATREGRRWTNAQAVALYKAQDLWANGKVDWFGTLMKLSPRHVMMNRVDALAKWKTACELGFGQVYLVGILLNDENLIDALLCDRLPHQVVPESISLQWKEERREWDVVFGGFTNFVSSGGFVAVLCDQDTVSELARLVREEPHEISGFNHSKYVCLLRAASSRLAGANVDSIKPWKHQ